MGFGKRYVLILPDGAGDRHREGGLSPLARARLPHMNFLALRGINGRMRTLYPELPKESLVAQLGMLGWDPRVHYPRGRASCEFLALDSGVLGERDLAFRANLARVEDRRLLSYNADYIKSDAAGPLVDRLNRELSSDFPEFELYHNCDFRNTLVVRGAGVEPDLIHGPEPHESHGEEVDAATLLNGRDARSSELAARINRYLAAAVAVLDGSHANMLFPWSASRAFRLPPFHQIAGFTGRAALVASMDFLHGLAKAGGIEFFKIGNGRPDTDYAAKGAQVVSLLDEGCELVVCHVNAPDEAAHMGDVLLKIHSLEQVDRHVVGPVVRWFQAHPDELGGVMVVPDHYTNIPSRNGSLKRIDVHSLDPVPFALWNGVHRDRVERFGEDFAIAGLYGGEPISHLELLDLLLDRTREAAVG